MYVGEFGPIYTGDETVDAERRQILADQLDIYREYGAGWAIWMYKDLGRQGLVSAAPGSAYRRRFAAFIAKKDRLGADQWGSTGEGPERGDATGAGPHRPGVPGLRPLPVRSL